jgi:hypothetical protein
MEANARGVPEVGRMGMIVASAVMAAILGIGTWAMVGVVRQERAQMAARRAGAGAEPAPRG